MELKTYVINLAGANERMSYIGNQLEKLQIPYQRIDAVFGDLLEEPITGYDEKRFHKYFGKITNKRAIGCYFSHINVLKTFLASDSEYALVLEDDATLANNLMSLIEASMDYKAHWNLLRLSSFKAGEFLHLGALVDGHKIAYNTAILKNTAAYVVDRKAAEVCIEKLLPMFLPYDIALDREWDWGIKAACVTPFPVTQRKEIESQIPRGTKIRRYRTTAKVYNLYNHLCRIKARKRYFREYYELKNTNA